MSNIIINSLVVDVLTGYNHFPDLDVFAVHSQAMMRSTKSSQILRAAEIPRVRETAKETHDLPT